MLGKFHTVKRGSKLIAATSALIIGGGLGFAILLSSSTAEATSSIETSASQAACTNAGAPFGAGATILAAYQSTAGAVQSWDATRMTLHPSEQTLSPADSATPIAVCYLQGSFTGIPSVPGGPSVYSNLIVTVDETNGQIALNAARADNNWQFGTPPSS